MMILLEILAVAAAALLTARFVPQPWRGRILNVFKAWVTVRAFWLLLSHPVAMEDGTNVVAWQLIVDQLREIDAGTFWLFCGLAAAVKFVGILASMLRWQKLLEGQRIELPFKHIFGSFLIGRFIGTFLPSTAGLDGYKLYDAARFSGRTVEVTATTALEKVLGVTGIFLSFLVALPFGIVIFGEKGPLIATITVPVCLGIIAALLLVLWFPGFIQWMLEKLPLPGKARLEGLVMRVSHSAAAYRDKKSLVLLALFLSFIVHFTTAAMYYFTAVAIGAQDAEFWPIAFGSSIQILATVLSPFTIAGEGIREAAQLVLLGHMIGPAAAIVSAALGFWAAEGLTLFGGVFWWARSRDYRPEYCRVDGQQVDYEAAAQAALELETAEERARREATEGARGELPPFGQRLLLSLGLGFGAGVWAGILIGVVETAVIAMGGFGEEAQVLWYGPLAYALLLGGLGAAGGAVLALLPMDRNEIQGWTPSLAMLATLVPLGLAITLFRLRRDVYLEQMPPAPVLLVVVGVFGVLALALFLGGRRLFQSRAGALVVPPVAVTALVGIVVAGAFGASLLGSEGRRSNGEKGIPAALADRPNLILVMVDTLRADHLSCYGADAVRTPNICSLAEDGGTRFQGFSHASWTKPATASLLTSLLPSSHRAMSKIAALSDEVTLIPEVLQGHGYTTGGVVSNINLAPSFGFDQGYDEYHYLAPDYLAGAQESSSKLILYQIARKVWFKVKPGLSFGDFYQDSEVVNEVAIDWIDRNKQARFFLFLHYMDPHDPYFEHPYDGKGIARVAADHPDPAQAEEMKRLYVEEIEYLDERFGELLAFLRENDLYDDTAIVLTADHGEEFYEHGGWWHGLTLYDEQIHVPLLVKWAKTGDRAPATAGGSFARSVDVAPTLITLAGLAPPPEMVGAPLTGDPGDRTGAHAVHYAEEDHEGNVLWSLRTRDWKLIEAEPGGPRGLPEKELFHVIQDPGEQRNLHGPEHAAVAEELAEHAAAQRSLAEHGAVTGSTTAKITRAECERLALLGYADMSDCEKMAN